MHIHRPKPLHGVREIAVEVGVIVIGILIAVAMEQAVEAMHWRHKIEEAEAAMRLELTQDDGPQAFVRLAIEPCLHDQLDAMRQALRQGADASDFRKLANAYQAPMRTYDTEAWKPVVASDAGAHMGAERLLAWSGPYRLMPVLSEDSQRESEYVAELKATGDGAGAFSPEQATRLRTVIEQLDRLNSFIATASTVVLLRSAALGAAIEPGRRNGLTQAASHVYGACVKAPDLTRRRALGQLSLEEEVLEHGLTSH
jgi:hypothetical protein